jgi:hypothetical protein
MRLSSLTLALSLAPLTLASACSSSSSRSGYGEPTADAAAPPGTIVGTTPADGGTGNQTGCSEAAKLVYVVTDSNELYSFAPNTSTFTKVGQLDCPAGSATPNSMAVDRSGNAWVNFSDGALFKVSTADGSCQATAYPKGQGGLTRFGMAFATESATSEKETLYVVGIESNNKGHGLASIDLSTMKLTALGDFSASLAGQSAELTGTGDGRLFGFFTTQPNATLAEIDKGSGATSNVSSLTGVNTGSAWAFSFWGGDFWFYTASLTGDPSSVTRKASSGDGSIAVSKANVGGFRIVGAGVSTCAPTAPPR